MVTSNQRSHQTVFYLGVSSLADPARCFITPAPATKIYVFLEILDPSVRNLGSAILVITF